jgi:fluoroquinolone transport system permease protein
MRLLHAVLADIRFQLKHGFYLVYAIITVMYLIILSFLPESILSIALPLIVFSDPSVLGLFFIGGIILMEKGQGVLMVLVVSPLRTFEYILSKVVSLTIVSVLAAIAITWFSYYPTVNWWLLLVTTILTSGIFTLLGIIINAGCNTVNQYMLKTIPYMMLFILPCFALLGFPYSDFFVIFPSVAALKLMLGVYHGISGFEIATLAIYLLGINYLLIKLAVSTFEKKIVYQD